MFNLNDRVTSYSSQCIGIIIESVTYTGRIIKANKKSFKLSLTTLRRSLEAA